MDKFTQSDKHIFTERLLEKIDIDVIYTSMVANDKSIFVFGGDCPGFFTPSSEVRRYDFSDQKWHKIKEMPHYLWGATAQIIDDEIFIMGGGRQSTYTSYNLVYSISSNSWKEKASLPVSRKALVSGVIDGIIYISSGYHMWGFYMTSRYCYAYSPKNDTWKECANSMYNSSYAMSVVIDNFLYVLGGRNGALLPPSYNYIKMHRYCPETNSWIVMPNLPRPRIDSVAVAIDSKIFVLCGSSEFDFITMDYYDTRTRQWTISDIPTPSLVSPGVAIIDNKIYLTAGKNNKGEYNRNLYEITYEGMKE